LSTENGSETMFGLVDPHLAQLWLDVGHVLFVTSLFAALLSFHNVAARYSFALGRERFLPAWLGLTGRRFRAPFWGSLTQSILAIIVLALFAVTAVDPFVYLFFWWTVTGGAGVLILMTVTSLAVVVFFVRNRSGELARVSVWRRFIAPSLALLVLTAILVVTLQEFDTLLGVTADSRWRWIFPGLYAAAALLGAGWAATLRTTRPDAYLNIGHGATAHIVPTATATAVESNQGTGAAHRLEPGGRTR
jgi:amino acid transporter